MTFAGEDGLQPERTALAWRRTILALATGTAVASRYLGAGSTWLGVVPPIAALVAGAVLLALTTRRLHGLADALQRADATGRPTPMPGSGVLGALAVACAAISIAAAAYVVGA